MLVVGDDCALPYSRLVGRRGIAGTVLVHKVLLRLPDNSCAGLIIACSPCSKLAACWFKSASYRPQIHQPAHRHP